MNVEIVHLSDLHFGDPKQPISKRDLGDVLGSIFGRVDAKNCHLVISGDITLRGDRSGYRDAGEVISAAITKHNVNKKNIYVCPGNHDIVKETPSNPFFTSFDIWSTGLRGDKHCTFAGQSVRLVRSEIVDYLLINTSFHADREFGLVDYEEVNKQLTTLAKQNQEGNNRLRIAITHHHFVPVLAEDTSTTRNAHKVLTLLEKYGFSMLLHGHQHARLNLKIGQKQMHISGVVSFGQATPGYINGAAIYRGTEAGINTIDYYGISLDVDGKLTHLAP
jgi:3',5'-cyclic AMP phosphodiesterase CpdA